ncbi:MAG: roadblock/LC7 domain-containing protein [Thermoplasmatota archaeon]
MVNIEDLENILDELAELGVYGSAVVNKDGTPIASDLPEKVNTNTFSIMCATAMGAGRTANAEIGKKPLDKISIDSSEYSTVIVNAGRKMVLSVIVNSSLNFEDIETPIFEAAKRIGLMD